MKHQFQIDLRGVIDLLSEHLYSGPEVYVRELLQNAVDAVTARRELDPAHAGDITLEVHAPAGKPPTVAMRDDGIGLTPAEVHKFLATIGLSSKRAADGKRTGDFLGQFGIGILSGFVVADEIVLLSRSARDTQAPAVEWRAKADGTYTLKELPRGDAAPGTEVWLTAKPGSEEQMTKARVLELARHFGALLPYPVKLVAGRSVEIVTDGGPIWRHPFSSDKERQKALLRFGREAFDTKFFDAVPLKATAGGVDGVAFVLPHAAAAGGGKRPHRVYLRGMFLSDSADNLLPDWAFFVRAVVDVRDLRPTASREGLYEDAKLAKVRDALGGCLRTYLVQLADHRPERLAEFVSLHHRPLKALAAEDDEFYRIIIDHLPFETTLGEMTFAEYRADHTVVRYVPDLDAFRQVKAVAAAQNRCVINGGYSYDSDLLARAPEAFDDLTAEALDPAAVAAEFDELDGADESAADALLSAADAALRPFRVRTEARRFPPADLPALYTTSAAGRLHRSLEQAKGLSDPLWGGVLDALGRGGGGPAAQLCLNFDNPLVRKLAAAKNPERLARAIRMLYVQSLLLGHHPLSPDELAVLNDGLHGLADAALNSGAT